MERRLSVLLPICAAHEGANLVYFGDDPVATASAASAAATTTTTAATSTATATHAASPARHTDVEPSPDAAASSPDVLPLAARLARARRAAT